MILQVFHDLYKPCYILSKFKLLKVAEHSFAGGQR